MTRPLPLINSQLRWHPYQHRLRRTPPSFSAQSGIQLVVRAKRTSIPSPLRGEGDGAMKSNLCHERAHAARGSNFLLLRQKKVTKEKATPTFALVRDSKRKRRAVRNSLRSNNGPLHRRFHSKSRGRIHGGPSNRNLIAARLDYEGERMFPQNRKVVS